MTEQLALIDLPRHIVVREAPGRIGEVLATDAEVAKWLAHRDMKRCPRCGDTKPLDEFAIDRSKVSGIKSCCKACDRELSKARTAKYRTQNANLPRPVRVALGSTTARGYGWSHQKLRAQLKPEVDEGLVNCARCGQLITPDPDKFADGWELDHDPTDPTRTRYLGPSHTSCNRGGSPPSILRIS